MSPTSCHCSTPHRGLRNIPDLNQRVKRNAARMPNPADPSDSFLKIPGKSRSADGPHHSQVTTLMGHGLPIDESFKIGCIIPAPLQTASINSTAWYRLAAAYAVGSRGLDRGIGQQCGSGARHAATARSGSAVTRRVKRICATASSFLQPSEPSLQLSSPL